jgi:hypothetical protein
VRDQVIIDFPTLTAEQQLKKTVVVAKKKSVTIGFLKRADRKRYGGLWSDLENNFTRGQDHYPNDLTGAYNLLLNYKPPPSQIRGEHQPQEGKEISSYKMELLYRAQMESFTRASSVTTATSLATLPAAAPRPLQYKKVSKCYRWALKLHRPSHTKVLSLF